MKWTRRVKGACRQVTRVLPLCLAHAHVSAAGNCRAHPSRTESGFVYFTVQSGRSSDTVADCRGACVSLLLTVWFVSLCRLLTYLSAVLWLNDVVVLWQGSTFRSQWSLDQFIQFCWLFLFYLMLGVLKRRWKPKRYGPF